MSRTRFLVITSLVLLVFGCKRSTEQTTATTQTVEQTSATTAAATVATETTAAAVPTPVPATPAGPALASQETNWKGVTASVTEFRRKGNTLTAKVRLANSGAEPSPVDVVYKEVYLIDTAGGKKYEVLKDEKGAYIAALLQGWDNRWYGTLKPGESHVLWMKFPAPPAEVKAITLQLPNTAPFEDVPIQD